MNFEFKDCANGNLGLFSFFFSLGTEYYPKSNTSMSVFLFLWETERIIMINKDAKPQDPRSRTYTNSIHLWGYRNRNTYKYLERGLQLEATKLSPNSSSSSYVRRFSYESSGLSPKAQERWRGLLLKIWFDIVLIRNVCS